MTSAPHASRRIWIIGASAGIGAALARELAGQGAQLILSARDGDALQALAQEIGGALVLPLDLLQRETVEQAVAQLSEGPKLDAVICTAALYDPTPVSEMDLQKAEALVRVNVFGTLLVARRTVIPDDNAGVALSKDHPPLPFFTYTSLASPEMNTYLTPATTTPEAASAVG